MGYTYDEWGKVLSITGSYANTIGQQNPLRYRGYYYDAETGFYYLSSRYYDPKIGRWINSDNVIATVGGKINGNNIYSYCFNNPINAYDPTGNWPKFIKKSVKWVAKNVVNPIVKNVKKVLSNKDKTYSTGINISGTPSIFIFNIQAGVSLDTKGNIAIQGSVAGGITGGSPAISITRYQSKTNAPNINKLEGSGYQIGRSIGVPVYGVPLSAGKDFSIIPDNIMNNNYFGQTTNRNLECNSI